MMSGIYFRTRNKNITEYILNNRVSVIMYEIRHNYKYSINNLYGKMDVFIPFMILFLSLYINYYF